MANVHFTWLPLVVIWEKCQMEDINPENNLGQPPLHLVAISGHLEKCHMENINNPENNHGQSPLHSAAISGHLEKCQMENICPENNHGQPPFLSAVISGHLGKMSNGKY